MNTETFVYCRRLVSLHSSVIVQSFFPATTIKHIVPVGRFYCLMCTLHIYLPEFFLAHLLLPY